jgi:hypothetical protein
LFAKQLHDKKIEINKIRNQLNRLQYIFEMKQEQALEEEEEEAAEAAAAESIEEDELFV